MSHIYPFHKKSCLPAALNIDQRAIFSVLLLILVVFGCTRQRVFKPPPTTRETPSIRVAIQEKLHQGKLLFLDEFRLTSEEADYILDSRIGEFTVTYQNGKLLFRSEARWFEFENFTTIDFLPEKGQRFIWNGITYEGKLVFARDGNRISVINHLNMPDYLEGVIPHEIPSYTPDYYQAVLSQVVAARTYALVMIQNPQSTFFDIYSDTRDQVYRGREKNSPLVKRAVEETSGLILQTPDKKLVRIQYHSTCGGVLDHSAYQLNNTITAAAIMKDNLDNSVNCIASPLYRWVRTITGRNLLTNMVRLGLLGLDRKTDYIENGYDITLAITSRKKSGRVDKLQFIINGEDIPVREWQIRTLFADDSGHPLPSNLFLLKASRNENDTFYLVGAGFGHGRGLCQWGAIGQALRGKSFQDILKFYYPDLVLSRAY
ncbi:MAG: SpoIID/LytB domain-containing protein [Calditrichaeota bacterium]|nr:SpoIID/LytB domain-containing protein [Calditrichota bacterium]RQV92608.1 MAG: SpoIID/LytB domain-containing protein [bacterium]RQV99840.1 MAG: SpoIID/LytB domain-containing protein [Calditrichota bacterium]